MKCWASKLNWSSPNGKAQIHRHTHPHPHRQTQGKKTTINFTEISRIEVNCLRKKASILKIMIVALCIHSPIPTMNSLLHSLRESCFVFLWNDLSPFIFRIKIFETILSWECKFGCATFPRWEVRWMDSTCVLVCEFLWAFRSFEGCFGFSQNIINSVCDTTAIFNW